MKLLATITLLTSCTLVSCIPSAYIANLEPYEKQIAENPKAVTLQPEHVTPVGGFQADIGATVVTDAGTVDVSNSGVSGNVVVDLRSGK